MECCAFDETGTPRLHRGTTRSLEQEDVRMKFPWQMKSPWHWYVATVISGLVLSGCAARLREDARPPKGLATEVATYATQVAVGQCALTPQLEAGPAAVIGAALLTSAIAEGINRIGT